ncbi:MarR family transcriptional regulator [uncultured Sphaerochaeta sp.]|uniref:MarR family winged helix-turn-helix transcriptional regulator n=1 Tax=uncultured Sphaerochaeta sp. TaxID=886478 RepID=UPI002A0A582C|nr:MarR family transcriptional regulator [uncultured Sphaerochaeta sp.]
MDVVLKEELIAAMHRLKKVGRNFPPDIGLNMGEFFVLDRIGKDVSCSGSDIADSEMQNHPHFTKPAVSQMLNSLEKKGYIGREIDKNDRRKIVVTLTEEGKDILKKAKCFFNDRMDFTIARFGEANTRQLISLVSLLTDISEELKDLPLQEFEKEIHLD